MAAETLEERMTLLEQEMASLKKQVQQSDAPKRNPWWDQIAGSFADSEGFDDAVRLGREYRESQRMEYDEEAE